MAAQEPDVDIEGEGDDNWSDFEGDGDDMAGPTKCLLTDAVYENVPEAVAAAEAGGLQFVKNTKGKSTYDKMKIVNYIRESVAAGKVVSAINDAVAARAWDSEAYLKPFLETDPMLFSLDEESDDGEEAAALQALQAENAELKARLNELLLASAAPKRAARDSSASSSSEEEVEVAMVDRLKKVKAEDDDDFFGGYAFFDIHTTMLSDVHRTATYRTALCDNPSLMKGAVVMDVGCGTGILSMFAARGGARRVYAIDASQRVVECARKNIACNKLDDVIRVLPTTVESITDLPDCPAEADNKVDVLVSEWMGYCLLYEAMFYSVLNARDRFLKPGGAILPDIARMFAAGVEPEASYLSFWKDVYGFDMSPMAEVSKAEALKKAAVVDVDGKHVTTSTSTIRTLDLATLQAGDLEFTSDFTLQPMGSKSAVTAVVLWFDTEFSARYCRDMPVTLTTSPYAKLTHWHQTLLQLKTDVMLSVNAKETEGLATADIGTTTPASSLQCTVSIVRGDVHRRHLDITLAVTPVIGSVKGATQTTNYKLT